MVGETSLFLAKRRTAGAFPAIDVPGVLLHRRIEAGVASQRREEGS
jgi:hypothetical protein